MSIDQALCNEIVARIRSVAEPDRIILFGSAARGEMTPDSDIDLLIVLPEVGDRVARYVTIRDALTGIPYAFDLVLMSRAYFDCTRDIVGAITQPACEEGRMLYAA